MRKPLTKEESIDHNPVLTQYAKEWNDLNAGTKGLTGDARKEQMVRFAKHIHNSTPVAVAEPRLWAAKILTDIADGVLVSDIARRMANEVLGVKNETV